jgi:hypothetical protein
MLQTLTTLHDAPNDGNVMLIDCFSFSEAYPIGGGYNTVSQQITTSDISFINSFTHAVIYFTMKIIW